MSLFNSAIIAIFGLVVMSCPSDQEQIEEVTQQSSAQSDDEFDLDAEDETSDEDLESSTGDSDDADVSEMLAIVKGETDTEKTTNATTSSLANSVSVNYWVFVTTTRVYAEPKTSSTVIGKLTYGEKIAAQDKANGWIYTGQGWVQIEKLNDRATGFASKRDVLFVTVPDAVVHSAPKTDAPVVGKVTRGERVFVNGRQGNWLQIGDGLFIDKSTVGRSRVAH